MGAGTSTTVRFHVMGTKKALLSEPKKNSSIDFSKSHKMEIHLKYIVSRLELSLYNLKTSYKVVFFFFLFFLNSINYERRSMYIT